MKDTAARTAEVDISDVIDILIVDHDVSSFASLERMLDRPDINIVRATSSEMANEKMADHDFALALVEIHMPETSGLEIARSLCINCFAPKDERLLPIIFMSRNIEDVDRPDGYEAGGVDFIFKPFNATTVVSKVQVFLELFRNRRALQRTNRELATTLKTLERSKEMIKSKNRRLREMATLDALTGLRNRRDMNDVLEREFLRAQRYGNELSCLLLDLDFFKSINDHYGHRFGDQVLKRFASIIMDITRVSDSSFRYGGEEFLVLLPQTDIGGAIMVGDKIREAMENTIIRERGIAVSVTASVGVSSLKTHDPESPEMLVAFADKALYRAKAEGRNCTRAYPLEDPDAGAGQDIAMNLQLFKTQISQILHKTKKASIDSLELLVRESGESEYRERMQQTTDYIRLLCNALHLPATVAEPLERSVSLHDSFKIYLDRALASSGTELSADEQLSIEDHPFVLLEMAELFDFFSEEKNVLLYHHENFDGTGYPHQLQGDQIPLGARIFAIAYSLVAMISDRSYVPRRSLADALGELEANSGTQFDPMLVKLFVKAVRENQPITAAEENDT